MKKKIHEIRIRSFMKKTFIVLVLCILVFCLAAGLRSSLQYSDMSTKEQLKAQLKKEYVEFSSSLFVSVEIVRPWYFFDETYVVELSKGRGRHTYRREGRIFVEIDPEEREFILVDSEASRQYQNRVPMEEMYMPAFDAYVKSDPYMMYEASRPMTLPQDITYYTMEDEILSKAFVMEEGTNVYVYSEYPGCFGRGNISFPTYEKGLRYALPFTEVDGEEDMSFYYVYLEDLEAVCRKLYMEQFGDNAKENQLENGERDAYVCARAIDRIFFDNGVYQSPDLE